MRKSCIYKVKKYIILYCTAKYFIKISNRLEVIRLRKVTAWVLCYMDILPPIYYMYLNFLCIHKIQLETNKMHHFRTKKWFMSETINIL